MRPLRCRIGTGHGTRPNPRDHVGFAPAVLLRKFHFRIEVPDLLDSPLADNATVIANVLRKPLRARAASLPEHALPSLRVHGRMVNPPRDEFEVAFIQEHGHGVQVGGMGLESEPRRFERDGTPARERVKDWGEFPIAMFKHLLVRLSIDLRMLVEFLLHHPTDEYRKVVRAPGSEPPRLETIRGEPKGHPRQRRK